MNVYDPQYYVKNKYTIGGTISFEGKIGLVATERTITFEMFSKLHTLLPTEIFELHSIGKDHLTLYILFDETVKQDGYILDIKANKDLIIKAKNERGVRYALSFASSVVKKTKTGFTLPIMLVEDAPSFPIRGVIEGYYGTPWSHEERREMFAYFTNHRLNTYMYAPKMDPYHRDKWYEYYPKSELEKLKELHDLSVKHLVDFYYCIAPGHKTKEETGFSYIDDRDYKRLFLKLDSLIDIGIQKFGLLLDDIDYQLDEEHKKKFLRPGIAHAEICNKVYSYLTEKLGKNCFVMCPTEYHQIGTSQYREDLKVHLHEDIQIFWTGDNVCAEVISEKDSKDTKDAFGHDLWIWDNFPVSDFTYGVREYMAPIQNRTTKLNEYAKAYIINPSIHYQISKIGMTTMAHFAWNTAGYDKDKSFEIALKEAGMEFFEQGREYIEFNYPSVLDYTNNLFEKELVKSSKFQEINEIYRKVSLSAENLLKLDLPIIEELTPWLKRAIEEKEIVEKIIDNTIKKEELLTFLENIKFSGSMLLDYLIEEKSLLDPEEIQEKLTKRRGYPWYRVFEYKRWPRK